MVIVKGLKGIFFCEIFLLIMMFVEGNVVKFECFGEDNKVCVLYGIICVNVNNMVEGVVNGFKKILKFVGVGYCV